MKDTKIYLITCVVDVLDARGNKTGRKETVVSHGVGNNSLTNYCLPTDPPHTFRPKVDSEGIFIDA